MDVFLIFIKRTAELKITRFLFDKKGKWVE
jgi:hypothetical protein